MDQREQHSNVLHRYSLKAAPLLAICCIFLLIVLPEQFAWRHRQHYLWHRKMLLYLCRKEKLTVQVACTPTQGYYRLHRPPGVT